jgi:hypothetical protein
VCAWGFFLDPVAGTPADPAVELILPVIFTAALTFAGMFGGLLLGRLAGLLLCRRKPSQQGPLLDGLNRSALDHWQPPGSIVEAGIHPSGRIEDGEKKQ